MKQQTLIDPFARDLLEVNSRVLTLMEGWDFYEFKKIDGVPHISATRPPKNVIYHFCIEYEGKTEIYYVPFLQAQKLWAESFNGATHRTQKNPGNTKATLTREQLAPYRMK